MGSALIYGESFDGVSHLRSINREVQLWKRRVLCARVHRRARARRAAFCEEKDEEEGEEDPLEILCIGSMHTHMHIPKN